MDAANIYSKELLDGLFKYPYTKIKFIEEDLGVHRHTARNIWINLWHWDY